MGKYLVKLTCGKPSKGMTHLKVHKDELEEIAEAAARRENITNQKTPKTKKHAQSTIVLDVRKQQKVNPEDKKKEAKELNQLIFIFLNCGLPANTLQNEDFRKIISCAIHQSSLL